MAYGVVEPDRKLDRTMPLNETGGESQELNAVFYVPPTILDSSGVVLVKPSHQSRLHEAGLGRALHDSAARNPGR
jgi:hypothetical protein